MANKDTQDESVPAADIQAQITNLMGLPPEEAPPTLNAVKNSSQTAQAYNDDDDNYISSSIDKDNSKNYVTPELEKSTHNTPNDTDKVVEDIIASESDELLEKTDSENNILSQEFNNTKKPHNSIFKKWWINKKLRNLTFIILFLTIFVLMTIPITRYTFLNTVGARASVSLKVVDKKYGKPIKNVEVIVAGTTAYSNDEGKVVLNNVKLGPTKMIIKKRSFAPREENVVIGWGSNPFDSPYELQSVGSKYSFKFTDWLSSKPVSKVEISDGESTAIAGEDGMVDYITEPTDKQISITAKANNYRNEIIKFAPSETADKNVTLVVAKPNVFVSKRSGKYDVYKRDLDGKNETVLLAGNGNEQEDLSVLPKNNADEVAFVSSREGKRNSDGYLLSNLYIINSYSKTVTKVEGTESERIQLLEWVGDRLVFVKVIAGPSAVTEKRQRLISYHVKEEKLTELASANYFNDVEVIKGQVYYAPSSAGMSNPSALAMLFKINPDGSSKTVALNKEVWTLYRSEYDIVQLSAADNKWYQLSINDNKVTNLSGAPAVQKYKLFNDNFSASKTVWLDNRDGKGVLLIADPKDFKTEKVLQKAAGLNFPVQWYSDEHLVYRVSNSQETADYVINVNNNKTIKIGDVTNTSPTSRWYYYR